MSHPATVPLDQLHRSRANARRTHADAAVEDLAVSILAHGLLQNLVVCATGPARYEVVAGGRRLAALQRLAARGDIARDWPVPVHVVESGEAGESSLVENVHRVAMDAMDEAEAFSRLVDDGVALDEIARRFGVTVRHVEQRRALARLSAKIRSAYRKGQLTLECARAFCLAADHATQDRVFRQFAKPITHAAGVRHALTQGRVRADDRVARFVGLEAYEAAGGRITRDLFEADMVLLEDNDLLRTLAQAKLHNEAAPYAEAGWGWVAAQVSGHDGAEGCVNERLHPVHGRPTRADKQAAAALREEIATLEAQLGDADDDDPRWAQREEKDAALDAVLARTRRWDPKLIAHAGVALAIGHDGKTVVTEGLIRRADLKALNKARAGAGKASRTPAAADTQDAGAPVQRLSQALVSDLTLARTRALRAGVAATPKIALALVVHALAQASLAHRPTPGVGLEARPFGCEDDASLDAARAAFTERALDEGYWRACLSAAPETLLADLAICVAGLIDVSHAGVGPGDRARQETGDALAAALDLDMSAHWTADAAFWARAPKSLALAALADAPTLAALSSAARATELAAYAKRKKAELAEATADALKDARWLPDVLITPAAAGAFDITPAGVDALAATAA